MRISRLLLKGARSLVGPLAIGPPLQQVLIGVIPTGLRLAAPRCASLRLAAPRCASLRRIVWRRMLHVRMRFIGPSCVDPSTALERHCT